MIGTGRYHGIHEIAFIFEPQTEISNRITRRSPGATANAAVNDRASIAVETTIHAGRGAVLR